MRRRNIWFASLTLIALLSAGLTMAQQPAAATLALNQPVPVESAITVATLPNGSTQVTLTNTIPGKTNFLQASSDLVSWSTASTNVSTTNWIDVVDPAAVTASNRFYRAYQVP